MSSAKPLNRQWPLQIGATIGILGDGQLGRMLCQAAHRLGFQTIIMGDDPNGPAGQVTGGFLQAPFDDEAALIDLHNQSDAISFEWENIPIKALAFLISQGAKLAPSPEALKITQDRWFEKNLVWRLGFKTASTVLIKSETVFSDIEAALGLPAIIKTRTDGYDGKGQLILRSQNDWPMVEALRSRSDCVAEGFVDFKRELSIIGARGRDGNIAIYPPAENVHNRGILHTSFAPAQIDLMAKAELEAMIISILNDLDYVGVLAIECFETKDGHFLINELAPRVHNSGHWTQDGGAIDQFEQHIRAIAGWPLGQTQPSHTVLMTNLIGDDIDGAKDLAQDPQNRLHIYGKSEARHGRKMGHINKIICD